MGSVKKMLAKSCRLPSREHTAEECLSTSRENIHIHHREYRTVFSLDEYLVIMLISLSCQIDR